MSFVAVSLVIGSGNWERRCCQCAVLAMISICFRLTSMDLFTFSISSAFVELFFYSTLPSAVNQRTKLIEKSHKIDTIDHFEPSRRGLPACEYPLLSSDRYVTSITLEFNLSIVIEWLSDIDVYRVTTPGVIATFAPQLRNYIKYV